MGRELVLTSVEDNSTLRMTCPDQSWGTISVEALGKDFRVAAPVYVDMAPSLPQYFDAVAAADRTSKEPLLWETLEGEFRLEARRDRVGHIFLTYQLRSPDIGSNHWWSFTGRIVLELGAMADVCKRAKRFWIAAT